MLLKLLFYITVLISVDVCSMLDIVEYGLFDLHLNYFDIHFYHIARYNTYNRRYILHEKLNVGIVQVIQIGTK